MTEKKLLTKYAPLVKAGASMVEVKNALTEQEKDLSIADVDEIVLQLFENEDNDPQPQDQTQSPAQPGAVEAAPPAPLLPGGKKKYSIYRGQWHARKAVRGLDGKDHIIEWEFMREGKPRMTGVPCEPHKADYFNQTRRLRIGNTVTEQMIEEGFTGRILDTLDNPFSVREVNL